MGLVEGAIYDVAPFHKLGRTDGGLDAMLHHHNGGYNFLNCCWRMARLPSTLEEQASDPLLMHAQGPWAPRKIANPDYFLDESPLSNIGSIGGVAIEIWTMDEGYLFDNVLIANDPSEAEEKRTSLWAPKKAAEVRTCFSCPPAGCLDGD